MNRIICSTIFLIFLSSRIFAESNMMVFKILQNVPAFNSVSLQYLEETNYADSAEEYNYRAYGEIKYIMNNSSFFSSKYLYAKNGNTYIFNEKTETSFNNGIYRSLTIYGSGQEIPENSKKEVEYGALKDIKFADISQGYIRNSLHKLPEVTLAWMDYNYATGCSALYKNVIEECINLKHEVKIEDGISYLYFPDLGYYFNLQTLRLDHIERYGAYTEFGKMKLDRRISFYDYERIGAMFFPLRIVVEFFDENEKLNQKSVFIINKSSIIFNKVIDKTLNVVFPNGCHLTDEINSKNYIVTDLMSIKRKEDIISEILDDNMTNASEQIKEHKK